MKKSVTTITENILIPIVLLKQYFSPVMKGWLGPHWGKLTFSIIYACYYIALFPLVLKLIGRWQEKR